MSQEFLNKYAINGFAPSGFSMDTARPKMSLVHFGEIPLKQEHSGIEDAHKTQFEEEFLPFGKFEVDKYFDMEGDITDWCITLYPKIPDDSQDHINKAIETQPTEEARHELRRLYGWIMPIVRITPREGIIMKMSKSSLHFERDRQYILLSDGTEQNLALERENDPLHYNKRNGLTVKAANAPGVNGRGSDLYVDGNLKFLSLDMSEMLRRLDGLVREEQVDQEKIRLLVDVSMSLVQDPQGGALVGELNNK